MRFVVLDGVVRKKRDSREVDEQDEFSRRPRRDETEQAVSKTATDLTEALQQVLIAKYGPLLRHDQIAEVLDVSPKSLSNTLRRSREPNVRYLYSKRLHFGRRVRYQAVSVAEALTLAVEELEARLAANGSGNGQRRKQ